MFLSGIKKKASSFLQEKYKTAKLALTDVTQAELLTEEATNSDTWGPDAKTMTRISEAAFDMDDYCRIVDVIHRRLQSVNYREWRQSYKTLVLLEFLLTHGPEDMFEEFHCDMNAIRQLGKLNYADERGFNWGACMQKKSERILKLLSDEAQLTEARSEALKISKEIQGFGNLIVSPSSSSSRTSRTSSFGSYYSDSPTWSGQDEPKPINQQQYSKATDKPSEDLQYGSPNIIDREVEGLHLWDNPIEEKGSLLCSTSEDEEKNSSNSWTSGFCSRLIGKSNQTAQNNVVSFRSVSDVGKGTEKKIDRQFSLGF